MSGRRTAIMAAGLALVLAAPGPAPAQDREARVKAPAGAFLGLDGAVRSFRGIPFAEPPVGPLRWRPPVAVQRLGRLVNATRFGADCMQLPDPTTRAPGVDEDCLTLNIWTPRDARAGRLPVMVWVHGGGFTGGSGTLPLYDGAALAAKGAVIVTVNYRVGVFGFLAHPGLTAESPHHSSGNYGLMDQMAALRWVKTNIVAFGGDPANVTVWGQSAGASSLSHLIVSPQARGLFDKVILESPGAMRPLSTLARAEAAGAALGDIGHLRALDPTALLALNARIVPAVRMLTSPRALGPIADGWLIRSAEGPAYASRSVNGVPLIIGGVADEGRVFVRGWPIRTVSDYQAYIQGNFGRSAPEAAALYPTSNDDRVKPALSDLFSDTQYHYGVRGVARGMAAMGQPVWRYQFSRVAGGQGPQPTHGDELSFVFGNLSGLKAAGAADRALSATMMSAWVQFARTGDPNGADTPYWPVFDRITERYLEFGQVENAPRMAYRKPQLDFLDRFYSEARQ